MEFYKVLEDLMKKRNLSIPDISRATGLSDSTLRSIISRKTKNISLEVAFKLSEGLNVSLEELNGNEEISHINSYGEDMNLNDNIKSKRIESKMTLEEVAKKIGSTKQTVQKYESGLIKNIPIDKIELLAKALNTTPLDLLGWQCYEENINKDVGLKIFNARKNLKMTRAELGKKVRLHESTVKRYEDGQIKSLDIEKMKEFAQALNLDSTELLGLNNKSNAKGNDKNNPHTILLGDFDLLNDLGKREALKRVKELTFVPKYQNNAVDTIAAHNDYIDNNDELSKINKDIEDMKNW